MKIVMVCTERDSLVWRWHYQPTKITLSYKNHNNSIVICVSTVIKLRRLDVHCSYCYLKWQTTLWLKKFFRMFSLALGLKGFILCPLSVLTVGACRKNVGALTFSFPVNILYTSMRSPHNVSSHARYCDPSRLFVTPPSVSSTGWAKKSEPQMLYT